LIIFLFGSDSIQFIPIEKRALFDPPQSLLPGRMGLGCDLESQEDSGLVTINKSRRKEDD
jgi:hypothetical protein